MVFNALQMIIITVILMNTLSDDLYLNNII